MRTPEDEKMLSPEEKRTLYRVRKLTMHAIGKYDLLRDNDRVLIGLSGGKDSLVLTQLLAERMKVYKPRFEVMAAHISIPQIGYQSNLEYLKNFCEGQGVPFYHQEVSYEPMERKSPCLLCSRNRRKALFTLAEKLNCNKIAFGHQQDDALETLLLNMTFQGLIESMPPLLKMDKFNFSIIRPMLLVKEEDNARFAEIKGYPKMPKNCPFEHDSYRNKMKQLLVDLEQMNPNVRSCLWKSMSHINPRYMPPAE